MSSTADFYSVPFHFIPKKCSLNVFSVPVFSLENLKSVIVDKCLPSKDSPQISDGCYVLKQIHA